MKKHFLASLFAISASFAAHASITAGSISCSGDLSVGDSDTLTTMQCAGDLSLANVVMTNPVAIALGATGEFRFDDVRLIAPQINLTALGLVGDLNATAEQLTFRSLSDEWEFSTPMLVLHDFNGRLDDNSILPLHSIPEPFSWTLLCAGLALLAQRRR